MFENYNAIERLSAELALSSIVDEETLRRNFKTLSAQSKSILSTAQSNPITIVIGGSSYASCYRQLSV